MRTASPYGSWPSPITPEMVASAARGQSELARDGEDLCWLEQRPDEGGRQVVVRRTAEGSVVDATPAGVNVRSRVHEYGGGAYAVRGGVVWYVDAHDQRIHRCDDAVSATPITPAPTEPGAVRYGDLTWSADGAHLLCVRETHHGPGAEDVVNELVAVPADGAGEPVVLASGSDFVASPRPSPDGTRLAYVRWDHPNMPWDATQVVLADLDGTRVTREQVVTGADREESAIHPAWSPEGVLHLLTDRTGWWNLHRLEAGALVAIAPVEADLALPPWQLGQPGLSVLADGRVVAIAVEDAVERPVLIDPTAGTARPLSQQHTVCRAVIADGQTVWFLGASPTRVTEVARVAIGAAGSTPSAPEVLQRSRELPIDPAWLPEPEPVWCTAEADAPAAHAFLYPPTSPQACGPDDEAPPAIVLGHGGPTGHSPPRLSLSIAFWTSRGFAVVDVNYRGSSGFGRDYRHALRGAWGVVDVADVAAAPRALAERGAVDPQRLVVRGGSAGGYTVLSALAFTDAFAAGASYYGVADLSLLAEETHKFESRYLDRLVGPLPEAGDVYAARSPLRHAQRITCPVVLFQGLADRIVPPSQAEAIAAALARGGVPHALVTFADEDHGFRDAENLIRCLEAEQSFYAQVLGLPHPEGVARLPLA